MLELRNIHKYYNPGTVNEMCLFEDFNLTINQGEFVSVVGSNGSGNFDAEYHLRKYSGRIRTDPDRWKRYHKGKRIQEKPEDRTRVPESIYGNLSVHDDLGKYVSCGQ